MSLGGPYLLYRWNDSTGYGGKPVAEYKSRAEAKAAFDCIILEPSCGSAAVYDTSNRSRSLWTFPNYWDGHSQPEATSFDVQKWRDESR